MLASGYIKTAEALLLTFYNKLTSVFGRDCVKVAPVKQLQRCKAKLDQYKNEGAPPPYAACICDYLRATVLCSSLITCVDALEVLAENFTVIRVKQRLSPDIPGNKVILVNLVIKNENIKPISYSWSGWWDNQPVQMIAEVYICGWVERHTPVALV